MVFKKLKTAAILNKNDYIFQSKCYKKCTGKMKEEIIS
jgi:hypothetical protein